MASGDAEGWLATILPDSQGQEEPLTWARYSSPKAFPSPQVSFPDFEPSGVALG